MLVILRNNWWCGRRFRKSSTPQEIPDELRDKLPSSARVVSKASLRPKDDSPGPEHPVALSELTRKVSPPETEKAKKR